MTLENNFLYSQMNITQIILDQKGIFMAVNPTAERLFRRSSKELIGLPFTTVLDPYSYEKSQIMIEKTLAEGELSEWELDHLQHDGAPILLGYSTHIIKDDEGNIIGIGAIGIDLTNKLQLTAELAQLNQQLEGALLKLEKAHAELKAAQSQLVQSEKMRSLGQMVAGIAHEINNPSAFIANNLAHLAKLIPPLQELFNSYIVLRPLASSEQLKVIETTETKAEIKYLWQDLSNLTSESINGIERIRKIVLSLRNFSRLDESQNKFADINEGLQSTLQLIRPNCKDRIQIIEKFAKLPQIPCMPGELNQVFLNLLSNAVQSIEGQGIIEIETAKKGEKIVISIRDTGCGMDSSSIKRLGEPFFTTKPVGMGTGLGLSISYGIIERHHGHLRFESVVGQGTTAIVELPIK